MSEKRVAQVLIGNPTSGAAAAITDDATFNSPAANIGEATNVALMISTDKAVTFQIQAADDLLPGAGRNQLSSSTNWFDYVRASSYETASGAEGNLAKVVFAGAGQVCVDLSPYAPKYLRVTSADGQGAAIFLAVVTSG